MAGINKVAVIGAGTMGLGIAGQLANAGVDVVLLDLPSAGASRNALCERALERLLDPNQPGLLHKDLVTRIEIGNIEDDMDKLADVDWVAEAIVERLDVKRNLYRKIDAARRPGSIVTSNTSTIPISLLVDGMPQEFRAGFAIAHFFNPVRYMQLLEIVRGDDTRDDVIECLETFNDERMGKGIVQCRDTPGFLGNRVGVFAIQTALHAAFRLGIEPEIADAIFGRPMGIPKTGVFGLYDLIGIDLMSDVVSSLDSILPEQDSFHEVAAPIPLMQRMIEEGYTGNKSEKGGFYRIQDAGGRRVRETLDLNALEYRDYNSPGIDARTDLAALLNDPGVHGEFAWEVLSKTLCYAAELVPDVNESLIAIDDAMKLGYNWIHGPFEMMDAIGIERFIERLESAGQSIPAFLRLARGKSFYRANNNRLEYLRADGHYRELTRVPGVMRFSEIRRTLKPEIENAVASYFIIEGDIGLVEFHSKANTLDSHSMQLIAEATAHASRHCKAMIIHNDAQHFSCGVNLQSVLNFIAADDMDGIDRFLAHFQQTVLALKLAPVPVVAAPSGLSLGGGFEVVLHTDKVIFHANSVTGLVESLVGVVPGGGGVKEMLYRWSGNKGDTTAGAWEAFMNIGYGKTAKSPLEAMQAGMFREGIDEYVMNRDRLLAAAISAARSLSPGYSPRPRASLRVAGRDVWQEMIRWLEAAHDKGHLTPHDVTTGTQIARIVTGGDVDAGTELREQDLLDLERNAFITLAQTPETRARIEHMLSFGSPLRN